MRDMLSEIGLIGCGDTIQGNGIRATDAYVAQDKLRTGIGAVIGTTHGRQFDRRASAGILVGLVVKILLGLPRIEARLTRLLREGLRNSRNRRQQQADHGSGIPPEALPRMPLSVIRRSSARRMVRER